MLTTAGLGRNGNVHPAVATATTPAPAN
jgi:hypothetical protein